MRPSSLCLFLAVAALAQTPAPPAFDVASVKINQQFRPEDRATWLIDVKHNPGSLTLRNVNMTMLVAWAFGVQRPQVFGPDAMNSHRYDIFAKTGRPMDSDDMWPLLQPLLMERFKLEMHRESRKMEVLALILPKSGHKMTPSKIGGPTQNRQDPERGQVVEGAALQALADDLSRETELPIVDMTGLKGRFDFTFNVRRYVAALRARLAADPHPISDSEARLMIMQEAIEGELGLRLEKRQAAIDVVVVDRFETLIEN